MAEESSNKNGNKPKEEENKNEKELEKIKKQIEELRKEIDELKEILSKNVARPKKRSSTFASQHNS